ncbi:MAG: hypothetical protein IH621_07430 [Krumholzibacteria bacterium]|nr:hypothetical protein [Candidatus Krumholzibacteria bacterium]
MTDTHVLEIRLPAGGALDDTDRETLRIACEALAKLACGKVERPAPILAMVADGWQVRSGLVWVARAERGAQYEEAFGSSRCEALNHLAEEVGLRAVEGCP